MSTMPRFPRKLIPRPLRTFIYRVLQFLEIFVAHLKDSVRYSKHTLTAHRSIERHRSDIVSEYHSLEKGLSLEGRRKLFGQAVVADLVNDLNDWDRQNRGTELQVQAARAVLSEYKDYVGEEVVRGFLGTGFESLGDLDSAAAGQPGGSREINSSELLKLALGDFPSLLVARRSVRSFSDDPVQPSDLEMAVRMAQQSPSTCNRQTARVYWTMDSDLISELLTMQNGNRGFGHKVKCLVIVASELQAYSGPGDRRQAEIDGGLFAMSLMYSLSYLGLGSCALNWAVAPWKERAFRRLRVIPESNQVLMFLAVGHLPEKLRVPVSARHETERVIFKMPRESN